jgi:hypothetical protein
MLTREIGRRHRLSVRRDDFDIWRPGELTVDHGDALTLAYLCSVSPRLETELEWLEIDSTRDLWPLLYGQPERRAKERVLQLGIRLMLYSNAD